MKRGSTGSTSRTVASGGIGSGYVIAVAISWSVHHSVLWALLHGICGWFYVIAYALGYAEQWRAP